MLLVVSTSMKLALFGKVKRIRPYMVKTQDTALLVWTREQVCIDLEVGARKFALSSEQSRTPY